MALNKVSGRMYDWINYTWNPIRGKCFECVYCYMMDMAVRYKKELGNMRLKASELKTNLGEGRTIFVGSSTDMWAEHVPSEWISKVLAHCNKYPKNTYLFQSKNPLRFIEFSKKYQFPPKTILGTTIETNRDTFKISKAPMTSIRAHSMSANEIKAYSKMISLEPLMDFDLDMMLRWIKQIDPKFVSIGEDSGKHNLPEPSKEKTIALIKALRKFTEVKLKKTDRILGDWNDTVRPMRKNT